MSKVSDADVEMACRGYNHTDPDAQFASRIAMRAALEAVSSIHEAEPVAWRADHEVDGEYTRKFTAMKRVAEIWADQRLNVTPLYAHPAPISKGVTDAMVERMARAISRRYRPRFPDETDAAAIDAWVESNWQMQIEDARVFLTAAIEAHPAPISKGVTVNALEWADPARPTEGICFYDHCFAESSIGQYRVEWKSWKKYDDFCVYGPCDFFQSAMSLDGAKAAAQADFDTRVLSCLSHTAGEIEP